MCGFTCSRDGSHCAYQGTACTCGDMCYACANLIQNSALDISSARCIPDKGSKPASITSDYRHSAECLRMCLEPDRADLQAVHECPLGDCCSWKGVVCDKEKENVIELDFREDLALSQIAPVLNGTFPDFLDQFPKLKIIRFIGGELYGTLPKSLGFVDCTSLHPSIFCFLRQLTSVNQSDLSSTSRN